MSRTMTANTHSDARALFVQGALDALPLVMAAAPVAVIFTAIALSNGLSPWAVMSMSLFVFAGSAQFIAASLAGTDVSVWIIILTVWIVNLRHVLYATHLMPHFSNLPHRARGPLAFLLTDEAFATTVNRLNLPRHAHIAWYYAGAGMCLYGFWQVATLIGIVAGQQFPQINKWGLEVAMVVAFTGVVIGSLKDHAGWACAATAGVLMIITHDWPNQLGLLTSTLGAILVGMTIRRRASA